MKKEIIYKLILIGLVMGLFLYACPKADAKNMEIEKEVYKNSEIKIEKEKKEEKKEEKEDSIMLHIKKVADKYNIEYKIICGLIKTESNFNPDAVGDNGDSIGYCQIQPKWCSGFANKLDLNIYEPKDNIELCAFLLNRNMKKKHNIRKALSIYNSGNSRDGLEYADKVIKASKCF